MLSFFRSILDRVKALLITTAALDLEADLIVCHAERKAELLRLADRYDAEKLPSVALELRRHAEGLDFRRPLAGVAESVGHLLGDPTTPGLTASADTPEPTAPQANGRRRKASVSE